jgi:hypothetical protein
MSRQFRISVRRSSDDNIRWAAGLPEAAWTEADLRRAHGYELDRVNDVISRLKSTQPQGSVITVY